MAGEEIITASAPLRWHLLEVWRPTALSSSLRVAHVAAATFEGAGRLKPVKTVQTSWGRRLATDTSGGRRPNFDEATADRLKVKFKDFYLKERAATAHLPAATVAIRIKNFVMDELLPAEGVSSSYRIAKERIVAPVLRALKPPRRRNKL